MFNLKLKKKPEAQMQIKLFTLYNHRRNKKLCFAALD